MIVVKIELDSANGPEHDEDLGTLIIDNIATRSGGKVADYRVRMYRRNALANSLGSVHQMIKIYTPIREGVVLDHHRNDDPVGVLVAKALHELDYEHE